MGNKKRGRGLLGDGDMFIMTLICALKIFLGRRRF
jgi:hypothetical protein